jgi:hypothetical protein
LAGRKPVDDQQVAQDAAFTVGLGRSDRRRVMQTAAATVQVRRKAAGKTISPDAALRRVKEAIARWNPPGEPDDTAYIRDVLKVDLTVWGPKVWQSENPERAALTVVAAAMANWLLLRYPALQVDIRRDPALRQAVVDWAYERASIKPLREIVPLDC